MPSPIRKLAPCLFAIMIDAMGFGLVYPVMTAIFTATHSPVLSASTSEHMRHFYLGLGFLLYPLCMFFGTSFMADLSDNYGRKTILTLCMIGIALSFALMGLGVVDSSLWLLFIGRALSGLMAGSQPVAQAAVGDISTQNNKAKNMAVVSFSYCIGVMFGPLIGGFTSDHNIYEGFNLSTPFFVAAVLSCLAVLWLIFGFRNTFIANTKKPIYFLRPITLFFEAFAHPTIRLLALVFLLMQIGFSLYFQFIVVHMKLAFDYSNALLGGINSMLGIGFGVGLLVGMPLIVKVWKTKRIAVVLGLLTGIGQIIAALIAFAWLQWPLAIVIALFDIMAFTAMLTLFSDAVDAKQQGWAMGIANAMMALAWTITGFASNLIHALGTNGLILGGGMFLIIAFLILQTVKSQRGKIA